MSEKQTESAAPKAEKSGEQAFFSYKEKPLVRSGNTIYYGDMKDKYVCMLQIQSTKKFEDMELADKVTVQLMNTDPTVKPQEMVVKKGEKNGLYQALDLASIWLTRALEEA